MLKSLTIKNFRCFENLTLEPLELVNLIGGGNNVGKTALLEAIFLLAGVSDIEKPLRLNLFRGIEQKKLDIEDLCQWMFFNKDIAKTIEIAAGESGKEFRSMKIKLVESDAAILPLLPNYLSKGNRLKNLQIEYQKNGRETAIWRVAVVGDREDSEEVGTALKMERGEIEPHPPTELISTTKARTSTTETVENFSRLEEVNRQGEILETLQILEPRLKRLAVLVTGGIPMIYGDIDIGHLVPLQMMGEGVVRLAAIALTIANTENGTVLIDEIENGLHHSVLVKVWKAIINVAKKSKVQIFATTHSWECIQAAHEAFLTENSYDFRYHRLGRVGGTIKTATYDRETIGTSVDMNFEMR
ncbi:MAG: AAA family ATPase [Cyanobacteriota bacterium]|nr:AAA family ATPase [Cyanobacteriota bacterium]